MATNSELAFVLESAEIAFDGRPPFFGARLPLTSLPQENGRDSFVTVHALWTTNGFKPQWKNLAVVAGSVESYAKITWWDNLLASLAVPLGIFVLNDTYFLSTGTPLGRDQIQQIPHQNLTTELRSRNAPLFTPRSLGPFRNGQLALADLDEGVTPLTFD